ncbi:hypothetical protein GJ496_010783, partial [Pomphorhynchus laevis]
MTFNTDKLILKSKKQDPLPTANITRTKFENQKALLYARQCRAIVGKLQILLSELNCAIRLGSKRCREFKLFQKEACEIHEACVSTKLQRKESRKQLFNVKAIITEIEGYLQ